MLASFTTHPHTCVESWLSAVRQATMADCDGGDLKALGWLSTVTLTFSALEVEGGVAFTVQTSHSADKKHGRVKIHSASSSSSSDDNENNADPDEKKRKSSISRKRRAPLTSGAGKAKGGGGKKRLSKKQRADLFDVMAASQLDPWSTAGGENYIHPCSGVLPTMGAAGWMTECSATQLHSIASVTTPSKNLDQLGSELLEFSSYDAFQVDGYYSGLPPTTVQLASASASVTASWQPTSFVPHTSQSSPTFGERFHGSEWGLPVRLSPMVAAAHDTLVVPIA